LFKKKSLEQLIFYVSQVFDRACVSGSCKGSGLTADWSKEPGLIITWNGMIYARCTTLAASMFAIAWGKAWKMI